MIRMRELRRAISFKRQIRWRPSALRNVVLASFFSALAHTVPADVQREINNPKITSTLGRNFACRSIDFANFDVLEMVAVHFDLLQVPDAIFELPGGIPV